MDYAQIIALAISGIEGGIALVTQLRAAAAQAGALTPEQDAAFDAQLKTMFAGPEWKTDAQRAQ